MPRWSNFHYLKFHKPFEVLSQFSPSLPKLTLKNFISVPGVYPAGRLDYRSEGLLLLTDDSVAQHRLTSPQYQHPKTYLVQVEGLLSDSALQAIQHMDSISGQPIRPVTAEFIPDPGLSPRLPPVRDYHPTCWLRITLHEGKKTPGSTHDGSCRLPHSAPGQVFYRQPDNRRPGTGSMSAPVNR